ncbi:PREDICTED: transcriptional regulator ATRX-like [Cyprinodon variegatus]|uniref:transcriptional regulator ATRX-like n=1 Tax=Cyprinodon variegatus TaxID=28743 RepID=UPI00074272B6|nr:PREDICTED: transcriptional regulator ATRX-like [Cyprinodon variegatus]
MEEKIYDRQVAKQSLSFRVIDHQQIERHFTLFELTDLYTFEPDLLDDPNSKKSKRPTPILPKDSILAQLLQICKDWIVSYHEHQSLLDHKQEEELSEADRKAAWAEYEAESNKTNAPTGSNQDGLQTKTNEQLLEILNKSRMTLSSVFLSLQQIRTHSVEDYVLRLVSEHNQRGSF